MARSVRIAVASLFLGLCCSQVVSAQQVWGQGGLGTVFIGLDASNRAIYKKYYLIAVGPEAEDVQADYAAFKRCTKDHVVALVENNPALWKDLIKIPTKPDAMLALARAGQSIDAQAVRNFQQQASGDIRYVLVSLRQTFYKRLKTCSGFPAERLNSVRFGIVKRICTKSTCRSTSELRPDADEDTSARYEKFDEFVRTAGIRGVNEALEIDASGALKDLPFRKDSGNSNANLGQDDRWPIEPTAEEAQEMFERGVVLLRKWSAQYASIAPMAAGVSRDTARRVLDVIENPAFAIPQLRSLPPEGKALLVIADEIAQSRIRQCINFQGKRSAKEIGACAGYRLDDTALVNCLSAKSCVPEIHEEAWLNAAEIVAPTTLARLADTSVTRILPSETQKWEEYRDVARNCAEQSADARQATLCLTRASLTPADTAAFDCASNAASKGRFGAAAGKQCLLDSLPEGPAKIVGECVKSKGTDLRQFVGCSALNAVTGNQRAAASCVQQSLDAAVPDPLNCLGALGGEKAAALTQCRNDHGNDIAAISVCYFERIGSLPTGSRDALRCADKNSGSATAFAGCMGSALLDDKLSGDVGTAVRCAAQSGGSTVATLACMAGPKVRPEQQIALECLSQSADATTYAVCVGGRLTLRELQNCKDIDYGESGCYGDNNEIRKFLSALQINTDKGTVVGDVFAFQVKVATTELVIAETGLKTAAETGEKALRLAENIGDGIADSVHAAGGAAGDFVGDVVGGAADILGDVLGGLQ